MNIYWNRGNNKYSKIMSQLVLNMNIWLAMENIKYSKIVPYIVI